MAQELASPEQLQGFLSDIKAPVPSDRSFFVCERGDFKRPTELEVLLDPVTGLVYPLVPKEGANSWHHSTHKDGDPIFETRAGIAMKRSQVGHVTKEQHNESKDENDYHRFEVTPKIHRAIGHQVGMCVMAAAGAQHRMTIDTFDGQMWIRPLSEQERAKLHEQPAPPLVKPEQIHKFREKNYPELSFEDAEELLLEDRRFTQPGHYQNLRYGYKDVRKFFTEEVLPLGLEYVDQKLRLQFMATHDAAKGVELLGQASEAIVRNTVTYNGETIHDLYNQLQDAGQLSPDAPQTAAELFRLRLGMSATGRIVPSDLLEGLKAA